MIGISGFSKSMLLGAAGLLLAAFPPVPAWAGAPAGDSTARARQEAFGLAPLSGGETLDLPPVDAKIPSPAAYLGYPLGSRFTHWDRVRGYLETLAAASGRVRLAEYGRTYEGRPLVLATLSSPENLARLPEIERGLARLAHPASLTSSEREALSRELPAVVWLAYGVHGNETSSTEAAMAAAYALAAGQGETARQLERLIVVLDPLSNPDGRERYVAAYEQRQGGEPNPRRAAAEHWEPWPGGRFNHFVIDLNRDWAWASQQETRARLAAYRAWEPQVYVDFHEMGADASYFFPPAAEPIHPQIDRRTVAWLDVFGRANAAAFDRQGWLYFKDENYDLFYPGYGDSYPSLRGAVGMTYEMAGGGRAGLALTRPDGTPLRLADRVARHLTTSLVTLATAAAHKDKLLEDFAASRGKAAEAPRTYLWDGDQPEARALADLLALHGIEVGRLAQSAEVPARRLAGKGEATLHRFAAGTYAVSTAQPLGNLIEALLAPDSRMDSRFVDRQRQRFEQNLPGEFYDITAWSLTSAFNLTAWTSEGPPPHGVQPLPATTAKAAGGIRSEGTVGYLIRPQGVASYRLEAALQERKLVHRVALAGFTVDGADYPSGTIFVPRGGNPPSLAADLAGLLAGCGLEAQGVATSFGVAGLSLGSSGMPAVKPVHIGLVGGDGVDATSFGFLWSLLDRQVGASYDRLDLQRLGELDLSDFDVLVLPSGDYAAIPDKTQAALDVWNRAGGVLVGIGDAIAWLREHKMTAQKPWEAPEDDPESERTPAEKARDQRSIFTPGAILETKMSPVHPLTLGLPSSPPVLYEGSVVLKATGDPRIDVLVAKDRDPVVAGLAWPEAKERLAGSLLISSEKRGRGSVILFVQDPGFRLFWRATTPVLLNALLYGPSAGLGS